MDDRIKRRLVRLEERWRWLGALCIALTVLNLLSFVLLLVQARGNHRPGTLTLWDSSGHPRIHLDASAPEPHLSLRSEHGQERMRLAVGKDAVSIHMLDSDGKVRLALGAEEKGGGVSLFDESQALRTELRILKDAPGLYIRDEKQTVRVAVGMSPDGAGMYLADGAGNPRGEWNCMENDTVRFMLRDKAEKPLIAMAVDKTNRALVLFEAVADGKGWRFPTP